MNLPRLELKFKPNAPIANAQLLWIRENALFITDRPCWSSWTSLSFQTSMNVKPNSTTASSSVSTPWGGSPVNAPPVSPSITLPASVRQIRGEVFYRCLVGAEPQRHLAWRSCRERECIRAVGTLCGTSTWHQTQKPSTHFCVGGSASASYPILLRCSDKIRRKANSHTGIFFVSSILEGTC